MAASDVFVLPSLSEGFPVTVVEAMASGLPIVATTIRGLPEIIKDGKKMDSSLNLKIRSKLQKRFYWF